MTVKVNVVVPALPSRIVSTGTSGPPSPAESGYFVLRPDDGRMCPERGIHRVGDIDVERLVALGRIVTDDLDEDRTDRLSGREPESPGGELVVAPLGCWTHRPSSS